MTQVGNSWNIYEKKPQLIKLACSFQIYKKVIGLGAKQHSIKMPEVQIHCKFVIKQ